MKISIAHKEESCLLGVILFIAALCLAKAKWDSIIITMAVYALFALPGYLLFRRSGLARIRPILYGVPCGFAITGFFVLIHVGIAGWNLYSLTSFYVLIVLAAYRWGGKAEDTGNDPAPEDPLRISPTIFFLTCLLVFVAFMPFYYMGVLTEHGYAYSGLFGHDFILRGVYSVALANNVPPDSYFFHGKQIQNFYLLGYILPATIYRIMDFNADIRKIMTIICLINIPIFSLLVYDAISDFIRHYKEKIDTKRIERIFFVVIFCYSYHWIFFLIKRCADSGNITWLKPITNQMGLISQSWLRNIVFEPQLVLALMIVILVVKIMRRRYTVARGVCLGVLFSAMAMSDIAVFFICITAYGIFIVYDFVTGRERAIVGDSCAVAAAGIIFVGILFFIGVFTIPEYSNHIILRPYSVIIIGLPLFIVLHYGFLPVTAVLGIVRRPRNGEGIFMIILMVVCLFYMLFVAETVNGNTFIRKGLYLLRLPVVLFSAYCLYGMARSRWSKIVYALLLVALPTVISDVYALADVNNRAYTTYVRKDEMAAALWVKDNTERDAVVQSAIDYPGYFDYSLTVSFGERPGALSHWKLAHVFYPNTSGIKERASRIRQIFSTDDGIERYRIIKGLGIDYLLIGKWEQKRYPGCRSRIDSDSAHYTKVYSNGGVNIYRVL